MSTECNACGCEKPDDKYRACPSCRSSWRRSKPRKSNPLLLALENINAMACYATEENTDARLACLKRIGEVSRAAIAKAKDVVAATAILGLPFYGSWLFYAVTGKPLSF